MTPHVSKLVIWEFVSRSNSRTNQYDQLNRLLRAVYQKPDAINPIRNSYNESLWYDKNGNITALQRYGEIDDVTDKIEIDQLTYIYDPVSKNRLTIVDDSKNITHGFKDDDTHPDPLVIDSTVDYGYDDYGNMTYDTNKGMTASNPIKYNNLNLPIKITLPNGIIEYLYNAVGVKLEKKVTIGSTFYTTDYQSGYQYIDSQLQFFPHAEGYVNVVNGDRFNYVYNYTDHLGNIRVSYGLEPGTNALKILEENHYYPFGLKHKNYGVDMRTYRENGLGEIRLPLVSEVSYKYKYNGKEFQDELGLNFYDYGARNYDAALGRWMNMDPLAENSRRWTPYNYAYNNPMYFVDPDGMQAEASAELNEDDFDKMINVGYGREVAASSFSGAVESSGLSLKLNEKGQEKIVHYARSILQSHDIKPDEELRNLGGFNTKGEVEKKESYANEFIKKITLLDNLFKYSNPTIKFAHNIPYASADYNPDTNTVRLTYASFETNLTLFYDLVHEGLHGYDHKMGTYIEYGFRGMLTTKSSSTIEARAWRTQVFFSDNRENTIRKYEAYKSKALDNGYNVEKWDINKFFSSLMNK